MQPFIVANGAKILDIDLTIFLQGPAVFLAKKDMMENTKCCKWSLDKLVKEFVNAGGKIHICSSCLKERDIKEDEFVRVAGAVELIDFAPESIVLTY